MVRISDSIPTFIISSSIGRCICAWRGSDVLIEFDYMLGTLQRRSAGNEPWWFAPRDYTPNISGQTYFCHLGKQKVGAYLAGLIWSDGCMIIVFANPLASRSMRAEKKDIVRIKAGIIRKRWRYSPNCTTTAWKKIDFYCAPLTKSVWIDWQLPCY